MENQEIKAQIEEYERDIKALKEDIEYNKNALISEMKKEIISKRYIDEKKRNIKNCRIMMINDYNGLIKAQEYLYKNI